MIHNRRFTKPNALSVTIVLLILGVLAYLVYRQREVLFSFRWQLRPLPVILTFLVFSLDLFVVAMVWGSILNTYGQPLRMMEHMRIFSLSNVTKRLPGTIWYVASRVYYYQREGLDAKIVTVASGIEYAVGMSSGILASFIFAIPILIRYQVNLIFLGFAFLLIGAMLHPRILQRTFALLHVEASIPSYPTILRWVLTYLLVWTLGGILFFLIGNIIVEIPIQEIFYMIGCYALVGVLSSFLLLSISNFGVTEIGLSLLLSNILPSPIAVIIALLTRLLIILYELVWASLFVFFKTSPRTDNKAS